MIQEKLYYIDTGYAVFGIVTDRYDNKVIRAAHIANWTVGKNIASVLRYYAKKDAEIQVSHIRYYR